MKKKELGLGTLLLLGIGSFACFKGMQAVNAKMEKDAAKKVQKLNEMRSKHK